MAPRFDHQQLTLHLSVADLLERDAARSLGFANRGGFERLWVGQAIHSQYQERAMASDGSYQREVVLHAILEHRGWTVHITGRADGTRSDGDRTIIEEIKSVRPDAVISVNAMEMYQRQARLYAWMTARASLDPAVHLSTRSGAGSDHPTVELSEQETPAAELVLIEIGSEGSDGVKRHRLEFDPGGFELLVRRQINGFIALDQKQKDAQQARRDAGARLEFPFHRPRLGQQQIIDGVSRALEQGEHLLVEAPTGLGKTVSTLFPVLRHALLNDQRVYVLTAKTMQQLMANQVLDLLNQDGGFRSLQIRAKGRMCANGEVLCHEEYCNYARDYFAKLQQTQLLDRLIEANPHLDPDLVFQSAKSSSVCPFEVSLELSRRAQAVVCDYNYAFDPYVALTDFSVESDLSNTILVIDEIHNLVSRGRDYYSPRLSAEQARETARQISLQAMGTSVLIASRLERLSLDLAELIERAVDDEIPEPASRTPTSVAIEAMLPEEELWALRPTFDRLFIEYLEHRRETKSFRAEDPFVQLYFELLRFFNTMTLATSSGDSFSLCVERSGNERALKILCKDASRFLGAIINRCHSVIGLSATLSPPEFYRDLLGFDSSRTADLQVGNPFPEENRVLAIDSSVATTYKERERYYQKIADRLAEFAESVPGNCLALFPSYAFLAQVRERMPSPSNKRVLIQGRADTEPQRQQILETLTNVLFGDVLLLAVAGGVFAEGVDYPGDMLLAVVVVGPCLPAVTLEQQLLRNYFDERFGRGFEYSYVVPGMTRVVQAAGRLIRSPSDRGVIVLMDRRFRSKLYQRYMPADWQQAFEGTKGGHPATVARAFFSGAGSTSDVTASLDLEDDRETGLTEDPLKGLPESETIGDDVDIGW